MIYVHQLYIGSITYIKKKKCIVAFISGRLKRYRDISNNYV